MNLTRILGFLRKKTERRSISFIRISTGIIFIWFGTLKFFPQLSPAEAIVSETIESISFGLLKGRIPVLAVGLLEIGIGIGFLLNKLKYAVPVMYVQMVGTVLPLFLFPEKTWISFPIIPNLLGQYIIKNLVFIAVAILLGATENGAKLITNPKVAKVAKKEEDRREPKSKVN